MEFCRNYDCDNPSPVCGPMNSPPPGDDYQHYRRIRYIDRNNQEFYSRE